MWKKLIAALAGCGLSATVALAQPQLGAHGGNANRPTTLESDGFGDAIFAPSRLANLVSQPPIAPAQPSGQLEPADLEHASARRSDRIRHRPMPSSGALRPNIIPLPDRAWIWGSAELLLGNTSGVNVPPLVTTGPASAGAARGSGGCAGTTVLFGGRKMLDNWRTGMRTEIGVWFGPEHVWGASARLYSLFSTSDQLNGEGNGTNLVNLPQIASLGGVTTQLPIFVGFPGIIVGTVATTAQTTFTGGDLNLRRVLVSNPDFRFELFGGYRQMHLGDELRRGLPLQRRPGLGDFAGG